MHMLLEYLLVYAQERWHMVDAEAEAAVSAHLCSSGCESFCECACACSCTVRR